MPAAPVRKTVAPFPLGDVAVAPSPNKKLAPAAKKSTKKIAEATGARPPKKAGADAKSGAAPAAKKSISSKTHAAATPSSTPRKAAKGAALSDAPALMGASAGVSGAQKEKIAKKGPPVAEFEVLAPKSEEIETIEEGRLAPANGPDAGQLEIRVAQKEAGAPGKPFAPKAPAASSGEYLGHAMRQSDKWIRVRGARSHNLKGVDLDLPANSLVVFTGVSGSGKSTLAFDTLYAEGQRSYVESLSAYARQFLQMMEKPDVDSIEGLSPAISIEQKATSHNPRSTVGTVTEIHDYLRLLYARVGTPYCINHPENALAAQTVSQMVDAVLAMPEGTKLMILAPVVANRKGEHLELFEEMQAQGFIRFRVRSGGGTANEGVAKIYEVDSLPKLKKNDKHTIDVVIDRLKVRPDMKQRLAESFETALRLADGRAIALEMDSEKEHLYSSKFACPICSYSLQELEPRLFSFNNPMGACPECDGLGQITFFDPKRVVAHPSLSLAAGAVEGWDRRNQFYFQMLQSLAAFYEFDVDKPVDELPEHIRKILLFGSGEEVIPFSYINERGRTTVREHAFERIIPSLERRYKETDSAAVREELAKYQNNQACPACEGTRLRTEARNVKLGTGENARAIYEVSGWPLRETLGYFHTLRLEGAKGEIADRVIKEIVARLTFLNNVGLDYLSLERSAETLSGGEAQRIRLASQIGSGLTGVMYVLDEPSIGLHQRDNDRLITTLKHLRDIGNSVIVVEHDEDMIRMADYVVDMGPGAGEHGGIVIAQGTPKQIENHPDSTTGAYLSGQRRIPMPTDRKVPDER